jgi:hypothetical protein
MIDRYGQEGGGMVGEEDGIILTDGISRVVLAPAGPPALGFPTRIEVSTGPFSAVIEAEAWDYERFRDALFRLHETLAGEAELTFVEGGHSVTLTGDGRGGVEATVVVGDGRSPCHAFLTVKMALDQSYLPDLIDAIWREFQPRS